jgi:hypothetical protein
MIKRIPFIICLFIFNVSAAQDIPVEYLGIYKGELKIFAPQEVKNLQMEFEVSATDTIGQYHYILKYIDTDRTDVRNFKLISNNAEKGIYTLDENNGIKIPTTFVNNSLQSLFKVQNSLLASKISFVENAAVFEISVANTARVDSTQTYDGNFKVEGFPIGTYQIAKLKKQ